MLYIKPAPNGEMPCFMRMMSSRCIGVILVLRGVYVAPVMSGGVSLSFTFIISMFVEIGISSTEISL